MSNEIVHVQARQVISFSELQQRAAAVAKSGMFACKTTESALTLMMLSEAEDMHPMQALRIYHLIEGGKPSMRADAMQARYESAGGRVDWTERAHDRCEAIFHFPNKRPLTVTWTIEDAKQAGLSGKDNWRRYTRQMLSARVISEGVRAQCPAVIVGMYTPEEVQDFTEPLPPQGTTRIAPAPAAEVVDGDIDQRSDEEKFLEQWDKTAALVCPDKDMGRKLLDATLKSYKVEEIASLTSETLQKILLSLESGGLRDKLAVRWEEAKKQDFNEPAAPQAPAAQAAPTAPQAPAPAPAAASPQFPPVEIDFANWDSFMDGAWEVAAMASVDPNQFTAGIHKAVSLLGKTGNENSISVATRQRWYEAIKAGAFNFSTGKVNQVQQALSA